MGKTEDKLKELGYSLPPAWSPGKLELGVVYKDLYYSSGVGSGSYNKGKLGSDLTVEQGYEAARKCCLQLLANMKAVIGDLDKVVRFVKLLSTVNSAPDFGEQPQVANGCTDLLIELYGEKAGRHARSAIGMGALPGNCAVEIEMIVQIEP
jgi:enamine deaminase RidA (YjgF/YER057c/UK114 family)